ncbi:MAG: Stk1 family PASTA domain-containing Ser/Thr kinase [Vescimonas sp.]|uniref:Stk1 family PASTA domain-containing Ser/Thr kinase n=1 Tax=Vescimonas sp. TaxID=2892404 RepID=UPI002A91F476|nr:Stk1 family PASTA domain-containing Ser/Thr kinase [Vescimonas sp.]MCI6678918.1 Stk1 family PASTA domain-containing Ser/Thr kinase [Oscillibacter sp.]MDY5333808.1 Stk1 family PASTA domain-containing Ser/Thr kinase [Vescimonas sp.]
MDQYIGKMLDDRYEILELIGTGGMANVYKARCHRLNRLVAIKILKSDLADNADFRRRFHDESQAVAQLSHANIVSVYDVSTNPDREYIVMELIDGITLKQYMERRGRMDWRESLHFITQIMRGLSHAHSRGIIHRDIKPQNIMVLRDGSVKVADFGIACLANAGQTLTQEALGSVHYISPEQARGDRIDARSDIYSAGVVLYEMLTGRLPFEGDSAVSVAIQHLSSVPLAPRDIDPSIPEPLELICMKAMNSDPNKRYASADAMIEDLEKFRRDPSVDMDYIRQELSKPAADSEPTMPIPTAQVASAVKKHTGEVRREPEDDEPPRRDKRSVAIIAGIFAAAVLLVVLLFKLILGDFGPAGSNKSYTVPDVRGMTVEEAQEAKGVKDIFTVHVQGTRKTDEYQPGQIVEQDPIAGRTRKSNFVIEVYVAEEPEKVLMKDLTGMEYRQARVLLTDLGMSLKIESREESSDKYGANAVIRTEPAADEPLTAGQTVIIYYSTGPESVVVPTFTGQNIADATKNARDLGLTVGEITYDPYNIAEPGQVVEQSLEPTSEVPGGTKISFTVSGSKNDQQSQTSRVAEFSMPADMEGMLKVEFEQDGVILDSQYLSASLGKVSYTFTGDPGTSSYVCAYFTSLDTEATKVSDIQEVIF